MQTLSRPELSLPSPEGDTSGRVRRILNNFWDRIVNDPAEYAGRAMSFVVVTGVVLFIFAQLQPGLLFGPNMDVGGDTAAHVVAVNYMIHDLLPHLQITGWDPQWWGGFPVYVFYFPFPALIAAALTTVFPFAVAFKLVTALGLLLMPVAAYAFGRLSGLRRPFPALMAAAMLPMLFNFAATTNGGYVSWNIDGGTIASTMAGEFSFTLAMACSLLFLGVYMYALRTGRYRWLAAILFVVIVLCHVVVALFAAGAAVLITLVLGNLRSWRVAAPVGVVGALLAAFWLLPFHEYLRFTSSMGYNRVTDFGANLFPQNWEQVVQWTAVAGLVIALIRLERVAIALGVIAIGAALAFRYMPSGYIYNARWLPFWFLSTALLAAYAVGETGRLIGVLARRPRWSVPITGLFGGVVSVALIAGWVGVLPFYTTPANERNPVPGWAMWNYSGYQAKPGWHEFSSLVAMTEQVTKRFGCGLLDYEYSPQLTNWYGSTLVPMSFPLWTNGCVDTTEGLYYESSTTTPFHFLDQAEVSIDPSNPDAEINGDYQSINVADGVRHLQLMGVKYFLANAPSVEEAADADSSLIKVGTSPASADDIDGTGTTAPKGAAWDLYLITGSSMVTPLDYQPIVESGMSKDAWQAFAITWYQNKQYWSVPITATGPTTWQRRPDGSLVPPSAATAIQPTTVSAITTTNSTVSFDVTRLGSPVLVKVPYFPNWQASGATGPYYSTPNLMIVVPTSHHVVLHYGTTMVDWIGKTATVAGAAGLWLIAPQTIGTGLEPGAGSNWAGSVFLAVRRRLRKSGSLDPGDDVKYGDESDEFSLGHHHYD